MTGALFDLEPHGTPCLVCGELVCTCRASGALEASLTAWPVPAPGEEAPALPALRSGLTYDERRGQVWIIRDTPGRDPGYPLAMAQRIGEGRWKATTYDGGGMPFGLPGHGTDAGSALRATGRANGSRNFADDWPTA